MNVPNFIAITYFRCPVFELEPGCSHSTVVSDLCADCGADLRIDNASKPTASVSMIHSVPDLKVSEQVWYTRLFLHVIRYVFMF